jgi:GntR family transcriptional regulator, transcriptional repressor for pyruvate dehydrogenase complex
MHRVVDDRIERRRLSEELASRLRRHIIEQGLKPGDRLPTEIQMAERFGVSRTVVREATKMLGFLGIIKAVPFQGMVLGSFDFDRVGEYLGFHFALSDYPADDLLKARDVIETGALRYVTEAMAKNPAVYSQLRKLAESYPKTDDAADQRWLDYEIAFHRGLVEASGIGPLGSFCEILQTFFQKVRPALHGVPPTGCEQHLRIVDALCAGDLHAAIDLLHGHVRGWPKGALHHQASVDPTQPSVRI